MAISRLCSVPDCGKPHYGNGLCNMHRLRLKRHGNLEGAGTPKGAPLKFVEDSARADHDDCIVWPFNTDGRGYGAISFNGKDTKAHRVSCELAHGEPPSPDLDAAHSCGTRLCVNGRHLRWATRAENHADKIDHGTSYRGEKLWCSKLTETDVRQIAALTGQVKQADLARAFSVSPQAICDIQKGRNWSHITGLVPPSSS